MNRGGFLLLNLAYTKYHQTAIGSIIEYNTKVKTFKNGIVKLNKTTFSNYKGLCVNNKHNGSFSSDQLELKTQKYLKKVKTNIIDLAFNYDKWEYFITLTFNDKEIGEYSHENAIKCLTKWIDNQKHQNRDFTYLLVPEFHKSGRLHFHGLVAHVPKWKLEEGRSAKTRRLLKVNGLQIYNLKNYNLGYTTISKIQSQEKVSNYISKYATKDLIKLKNKKRYWYSRNLQKPKEDYFMIDTSLKEYIEGRCVDYYEEFKKLDCSIEVARLSGKQLPIIDKM